MRLYRETNQLAAQPLPGRVPRIDEAGRSFIRQFVESRPDATLKELAEAYRDSQGPLLALCIFHRALVNLGLTRKKRRSTRASENATT